MSSRTERRSGDDRRMSDHEPMPTPNEKPATWTLVMHDMKERHEVGIERYGTPLQPANDRNSMIDSYQEMLDQIVYFRNHIEDLRIFMDLVGALFYRAGFALPETRYNNLTQLGRDLSRFLPDIGRVKEERDMLYSERKGEVWFWSTGNPEDGDNAATIICPIIIEPQTLQQYFSAYLTLEKAQPVPMLLWCPRCGAQHIDQEETEEEYANRPEFKDRPDLFGKVERWTNPPHKSHKCQICNTIWRPAEVFTIGVTGDKIKPGKDDTWKGAKWKL